MAKIGRPGMPSATRQQVWEMWKTGDSLSVIAPEERRAPDPIFTDAIGMLGEAP